MTIYFKSVQRKALKTDGIRICIMRRPDPNVVFNVWVPELAPSGKLLDAYHKGNVDWQTFEKRFTKEVLQNSMTNAYLEGIVAIAKQQKVTLLCWEETPKKCHRRLIAEHLKKLYPQMSLVLK